MRRTARALAPCLLAAAVSAAACARTTEGGAPAPPWEVWDDPRDLPRLTVGDQVLLRSSYCPWGCRFDRHSAGDPRFIRLDGDEGVIFEDPGAGAIVRLWMTMGQGVSTPLDAGIRLRIYLDGEAAPRVEAALPDFFAGTKAPFLPPLVGDRTVSSGGNFSYVPIPYRQGCRVTLTGAAEATIWYQVTYHRLSDARGVATFTGAEDLSRLRELLGAPGDDPWPEAEPADVAAGKLTLAAGESAPFYAAEGSGLITGLRLEVPPAARDGLRLRLAFDDRTTVDLALSDFFAVGRGGALPTRSLLVGRDALDRLYTYFPMPYFRGVTARLARTAGGGEPLEVGFWVRRSARRPAADSGLFGARLEVADPTPAGTDAPLLRLTGAGKWVGLFADLGSVDTDSRLYLEGDERVYLDGSRQPAIYGTGTEDLFGGGFYFDRGPFRAALHGMSYQLRVGAEDVTGAYRLFFTDAVPFGSSIRAGLETGPTGETPMRTRAVAFYYRR